MKAAYTRLQDLVNRLVDEPIDRCDVLTTAIALAQSRLVPLPTAPVASPANYYNLQVLNTVMNSLGELNEQIVFDLKCAINETRQFWLLRYNAAHPGILPIVSDVGFVDTIVGAGIVLDKDLHCFANKYKDQILRIATDVTALLQSQR
jgi:hypothetical protein